MGLPVEVNSLPTIAGERNTSSTTNSYLVVHDDDYNIDVVDTSTDTTTVSAAPARLGGVYINTTLSAHTVVIKDNTVAKFTIPASAAAGTFYPFKGRFETSLIVDPDDSSTGSITVLSRPI